MPRAVLAPYRYRGQCQTTVMARVSHRFVKETLWPEFEEIAATLREYLADVTERVVPQVICEDTSDAVGSRGLLENALTRAIAEKSL